MHNFLSLNWSSLSIESTYIGFEYFVRSNISRGMNGRIQLD